MRQVLVDITTISPAICGVIFAVVLLVVGSWLAVQRQRKSFTKDHLISGIAVVVVTALLLGFIYKIGHFRVEAYGAMLMLGFITGILSAIHLGKRRGITQDTLLDIGLLILVSAIIGARVLYWMITRDAGPLFDLHDIVNNGLGGLSFHGGLIAGVLVIIGYIRVKHLKLWRLTDCLAPGVALGYAITRIGCFLNGCCFGKECDLPWAVVFPNLHDGIPRHPSQLYASLMGLTMFGILMFLARGKSLGRAGRLTMVFFMLEGVERFVMEIFRQPDPTSHGLLTAAQVVSIILIIVGAVGWYRLPQRAAVDDANQMSTGKTSIAR
ncbi:MAG TPA: prolipoprotein diacylglyceryl transferase [Armatimonadota bacterium]|nr:prolipoprotein diacylglyceryl transferase [Armatimonadota bacterium]